MTGILIEILNNRKNKMSKSGYDFGYRIPHKRDVPLVKPDFENGIIITEIKRKSPSQKDIKLDLDPVDMAKKYVDGGSKTISVLTEEDYFGGSLEDLINVKKNFPDICVLRKDFIQEIDEVDISYRAGADMILLIVSVFVYDMEKMKMIYNRAIELGMEVLVEVHNSIELNIALNILDAKIIGINSRDLSTFKIDKKLPFVLKSNIPADKYVVYESGVKSLYEAFFIGASSFNGILIGTSILKNDDPVKFVNDIIQYYQNGFNKKNNFFNFVLGSNKTVVKICGITNVDDAIYSIESGANIVGFILSDKSIRSVTKEKIIDISIKLDSIKDKYNFYKVCVVTEYNQDAIELYRNGYIDCLQLHGNDFKDIVDANFLYYRAVNLKTINDYPYDSISPFVLIDSSSEKIGGSGIRISNDLIYSVLVFGQGLFLAGGIKPENVFDILKKFEPNLIDIASGVEESPGKKDYVKINRLFSEIERFYRK